MIRNIRSTAIKSDGSINQEEVIKWVNKNKKLLTKVNLCTRHLKEMKILK